MRLAVAGTLVLSAAGTAGIADAAEIADAAKAGRAAEVADFAEAAAAAEVAGVELADEIELGGVRLRLNGAGERTLYVVRTYVAALYVAQPSTDAAELYGRTEPRRLSLTMLAGLSTEWIVERLVAAIRANASENSFASIEPRLARLVEPFLALDRLQKGDRVDIDTVAGVTRLRVDGRAHGIDVPGIDVFDAMLRAFIGEHPIDASLRGALLGGPRRR